VCDAGRRYGGRWERGSKEGEYEEDEKKGGRWDCVMEVEIRREAVDMREVG